MRGDHSVTINRPATVVFDHIADGANNATWRPAVMEVTLLSGDGGEGTVWRQLVHGPGGKPADADYRVTHFQRPAVYGFEVIAGPVRGRSLYTMTAGTEGDTTVTLAVTLTPRGAMRILTGFVLRALVEELDSLHRLRAVLETPAGGSAPTAVSPGSVP